MQKILPRLILGFAACVSLFIMSWLLLPGQRIQGLAAVIVVSLGTTLVLMLLKRAKPFMEFCRMICSCALIVFLLFYVVFSARGARQALAASRFIVLQKIYEREAHTALTLAESLPDADFEEIPGYRVSGFLTADGRVHYTKAGDRILLYFNTEGGFFESYGYLYQNMDAAEILLTDAESTEGKNGAPLTYDWLHPINKSWMYGRLY